MAASSTTFAAAPLDRTARVVTAAVWLLSAVFVLVGIGIAGFGSTGTGVVLFVVGVLLGATVAWMRRIQPLSYVVEEGSLFIRRRTASAKRFAGVPRNAHRGALGWRVFGDGGGYGYLGRFRAGGTTVQAFVTDHERVVLLEVGDVALAVSPVEPHAFLAEVGRGA